MGDVVDMKGNSGTIGLPPGKGTLRQGGGGPYDPTMEQRVAGLEKRMDRVEAKLDTLNERTARMEGEISRLPGYPGLITICGVLIGLAGLIVRFL